MKGIASVAVLGFGLLLAATAPAAAQDIQEAQARERRGQDAVEWLAHEPVTLLDWGMMRLRRDLDRSVEYVTRTYTRTPALRTGVFYRFHDRRIVAYASFVDLPANRTGEACKDVYTRLAEALTGGGPQGAGGASWYLENVFSHDAGRGGRPDDLGDQLAERVSLQVTIGPKPEDAYEDGRRVTCTGRLHEKYDDIALRAEG
ncbi:hypothetical protein [Azospirillum sp. SYSU D00513]|uniref:hypothetical protein n=1 Tax=Azospirillum sp. SYSU D00513 TaxID=2812561 RepID=UPI001A961103|nr:hypothetical protein [Azospirillum sp. SYSU D00513]